MATVFRPPLITRTVTVRRAAAYEPLPPNLLLTTLVGQGKFYWAPGEGPGNLEWAVPRAKGYPTDLRTWVLGLQQSTLTPPVADPFSQHMWPNPLLGLQPQQLNEQGVWAGYIPEPTPAAEESGVFSEPRVVREARLHGGRVMRRS